MWSESSMDKSGEVEMVKMRNDLVPYCARFHCCGAIAQKNGCRS